MVRAEGLDHQHTRLIAAIAPLFAGLFVCVFHIIQMTQTTTTDRTELEQFLGQQISFKGMVVNTSCPTPEKRFICLRRMNVTQKNESVQFHHMWLDVSHIKDLKFSLAAWVSGCAYVKHYNRRDGSTSYGITAASQMATA